MTSVPNLYRTFWYLIFNFITINIIKNLMISAKVFGTDQQKYCLVYFNVQEFDWWKEIDNFFTLIRKNLKLESTFS